MKLSFFGACHEVTGSFYYLEVANKKFIIDCGLHQGARLAEEQNFKPFPIDPAHVDALLLTHAHLDHCGRIPQLVHNGFAGRIIATGPTIRLADLILEDSARVLEEEAQHHGLDPLYTIDDLQKTREYYEEVEYRTPLEIDDVKIEFFDAGHILGSSMIRITAEGKSIVFSGDLGNPPVPILQETDVIGEANYIVMESTYGDRIHEDRDVRKQLLRKAITETIKKRGVLMIPAFAMERTQELLYELNQLVEEKEIPAIPIFLDSPLAIKATAIFKQFESYFNDTARHIIRGGDDIFQFPGLKMTLQVNDSKRINHVKAPKVIIAGSGMAQGGRIVHHIERYISDPNSLYLIVGYQAHGSLGRRLLEGDKTIQVHGKEVRVKAKVQAIGGYSAHADQQKLTEWVGEFDPAQLKKVFLVHGEEDQARVFKKHLEDRLGVNVEVPTLNQHIELQ